MRPTASKLHIAHRCQYPWTSGIEWTVKEQGQEARLGSAFHEVAAMVIGFHVAPGLGIEPPWHLPDLVTRYGLDDEHAEALARMVAGFIENATPPRFGVARAEVAFAYDPIFDVARELALGAHREYVGLEAAEFVGTADVVEDGLVIDWKTGRREHCERADENSQLAFLALCVSRVQRVSCVTVALAWVGRDGTVDYEMAGYDAYELSLVAESMARLDKALSGAPDPCPGPHCRWCPILTDCPATQQALVEVVPPQAPAYSVVADPALISGPEHASWLLHRLKAVQSACEAVESCLRTYADTVGGIPVGDGRIWQRRLVPVERLDLSPEGVALLRDALPAALKETSSKTAIADAAKEAGADAEALLGRLREMGCIRMTSSVKYEGVATDPKKRARKPRAA